MKWRQVDIWSPQLAWLVQGVLLNSYCSWSFTLGDTRLDSWTDSPHLLAAISPLWLGSAEAPSIWDFELLSPEMASGRLQLLLVSRAWILTQAVQLQNLLSAQRATHVGPQKPRATNISAHRVTPKGSRTISPERLSEEDLSVVKPRRQRYC